MIHLDHMKRGVLNESLEMPGQNTAEAHFTTSFPTATSEQSAGDVLDSLRGSQFESASQIAVLDRDRLIGLVRLEDLLPAPCEATVGQLMDNDPPRIAMGEDQEHAAWKAVHHGESSLAVEDAKGRLLGLIPPHRMLAVLLSEHHEDLVRLAGFTRAGAMSRQAAKENVVARWRHRIPWLLVGLAGAVASALVVGSFEDRLSRNVTIAFFLPALVYLADAVGTQTETIVIRALSVERDLAHMARRELVTGLLVGVTLALFFLPFGILIWGSDGIAWAVAISLLAACSVATAIAMSLPLALRRLGVDPAYGSGPLATVAQDLITIVIYFAVVSALL